MPRSELALLCWLLLLVFVASPVRGAASALRGTVRDTSRNILPGVTVVLPDSNIRTVTDEHGEFSVPFPDRPGGKLRFVKPGYAERELPMPTGTEPLDVKLVPNQNNAGLIRETTRISLSHSLTLVQKLEPSLLRRPLTEAAYREFVARHGEEPPEEVAMRIYLPPGVARISAVFLISEHGLGGPMMEHRMVRDFADRHRLALVGVLGDPIQRGIFPADVLDSLLANLGAKLKHPELGRVPAFAFGHSNGTGFSALYAALRSDRMLGWISYHSGGSWHLLFPGIEHCPGLVVHGLKDQYFVNGQDEAVRSLRRERNAAVSLLVQGDAGHWPSNRERIYELVLAFFEACLRARAPHGLSSAATLARVNVSSGWLGENYDRSAGGMQAPEIAPYRAYAGDLKTANWLPDEIFARAWQRFSATGSINGEIR